MLIEQYRKETLRTLPDLGSQLNNSLHMTIGIMTEISEIEEAMSKEEDVDFINIAEEWADIKWYQANYANIHDIKNFVVDVHEYSRYNDATAAWSNIIIFAGTLLDMDKKLFAYGKQIDNTLRNKVFIELNTALEAFADHMGIDKQSALERNINKLKARYPDKFDNDKAINRDLETERKILEGN